MQPLLSYFLTIMTQSNAPVTPTHPQNLPKKSWSQAMQAYLDKRVLTLFLLGFSAGLPYLLIFSSLSIWLDEAGFNMKVITMFSWAALGYSFKFIWAPLVDAIAVPVLGQKLGHRRAWLLIAQCVIMLAIFLLGSISPTSEQALTSMAMAAVLLGFASATQDILIDAYRIEIADVSLQTALSASYMAGYRLGLIVAGAGALFLASYFGTTKAHYVYEAWRNTYYVMASLMSVGIFTTLFVAKPTQVVRKYERSTQDYVNLFVLFLAGVGAFIGGYLLMDVTLTQMVGDLAKVKSPLAKFGYETLKFITASLVAVTVGWGLVATNLVKKQVAIEVWVAPLKDFFVRYGKRAILLLLLIGLYRISDIIAGTTSNLFYIKMGFSKDDIAVAVKTVGVGMSILGGFLGGLVAERFAIMRAMMIGAILASASNLLFVLLANAGHDYVVMYSAVILDNLASGLAGAVFVAFLSSLTNIKFTAVQYALLSSLMTLTPKILGGYSGGMVESMGYANFYTFTALVGVPVLLLIYLVDKKIMK